MRQRVTAVQPQVAIDHPLQVLERPQLRLVVRIGLRAARIPGRGQPGQPGRDAGQRKVLRNAVILVPSAVLARLRDVQVADRAHPGLQVVIHATDVTVSRSPRPNLATSIATGTAITTSIAQSGGAYSCAGSDDGWSSWMAAIPEFTTRPELAGTFGMVASTHWLASAAGLAVLEKGGNAFDAAAAAG